MFAVWFSPDVCFLLALVVSSSSHTYRNTPVTFLLSWTDDDAARRDVEWGREVPSKRRSKRLLGRQGQPISMIRVLTEAMG